jgi:hypothetical protein
MTAEIVNLNRFRKARERALREKLAHENRLRFGQTRSERSLIQTEKLKSESDLDGARREGGCSAGRKDDVDPSNAS